MFGYVLVSTGVHSPQKRSGLLVLELQAVVIGPIWGWEPNLGPHKSPLNHEPWHFKD